ncbi:MAG: ABC transporter ATP-binding protein, partial [Bacilli bacterium]|nr:ABC transporter ATP-binding protein [Bacilli bacterium]
TLSGGQRQRIAMARAVIKNPPILILDDSVSAVDSETESAILHNIRKIRQDKTTVIVSSRISSVQNADHIIVMDKGKIIGYGTHEELLESCSLYKILVEYQALEAEAA